MIALLILTRARALIGKVDPLVALCLVLAALLAVEHHNARKWAVVAKRDETALSAVKTAQALATKQATQAKELKDAQNAKLAVASDQAAADLRGRYHAAVMQLADAQRAARRADLPGHANPAQSSDGPGKGAFILADPLEISVPDALTCADNTARLQAVHDWALGLTAP